MDADTRRTLSTAARALDFALAHPATDTSYTGLVAQLQDAVNQSDALAVVQATGRTAERAAQSQRQVIRNTMQQVQLRHLVRVATRAVKGHPELQKVFVSLPSGGPNRVVIAAAQAMLEAATPNKDLFLSLGLGDTFLDGLTAALAAFDQATDAAHTARRSHVGARVQLEVIAVECDRMLDLLDGFYAIRFRDDPQSLAEWESSRNEAGPFRHQAGGEPVPSPEPELAPVPLPVPVPVVPPPAPVIEEQSSSGRGTA